MRVTELQQACEMHGLDHEGLNKKGLIQALERHAAQSAQAVDGEDERLDVEQDEEDNEVSFRHVEDRPGSSESVEGASSTSGVRRGESAGTESLSLLELKLALAREEREKIREEREKIREEREGAESAWLIEKQRMELGMAPNVNPTHPTVRSDIARLLPRMT